MPPRTKKAAAAPVPPAPAGGDDAGDGVKGARRKAGAARPAARKSRAATGNGAAATAADAVHTHSSSNGSNANSRPADVENEQASEVDTPGQASMPAAPSTRHTSTTSTTSTTTTSTTRTTSTSTTQDSVAPAQPLVQPGTTLPGPTSMSSRYLPIKGLTKYERIKIVGMRAEQLVRGAKPFVEVMAEEEDADPCMIAERELNEGLLPMMIIRTLPDGATQRVVVHRHGTAESQVTV